jgi:hypothetical protein
MAWNMWEWRQTAGKQKHFPKKYDEERYKMKNILFLTATPTVGGNGDALIGAAMEEAKEHGAKVHLIHIREKRIEIGVEEAWEGVHVSATKDNAYYYSTYNAEDKNPVSEEKPKIMILGGGPNRIGQGIEFDYCCVHASLALRKLGFETIIVNCNPETVSTDYDTSDKLYFEPLTLEDVLSIHEKEKPVGVIAQFGGQTPLNLAAQLKKNGVNILGTKTVADLSVKYKIKKCMIISTDHAFCPVHAMGYSKCLAEMYVQGLSRKVVQENSLTKLFVVRFSDVYPDAPRSLMTVSEACQLILETGNLGENGEIYVFEDDAVEDTLPTSYEKIRKSKGYFIDYTMICEQINTLTENNCMQDSAVIINKMKKIISYFSESCVDA